MTDSFDEQERSVGKGRYKFLLHPKSRFRTFWDILIILCSLWNCILVPIHKAFLADNFHDLHTVAIFVVIDMIFVVDLVLNFRTKIVNDLTGEGIEDPKLIAIKYIKKSFIVDLLSTIPFEYVLSYIFDIHYSTLVDNTSLLSMLKIFRIVRFTKVISYLNATETVKLSLKLAKLIFYLLIYWSKLWISLNKNGENRKLKSIPPSVCLCMVLIY